MALVRDLRLAVLAKISQGHGVQTASLIQMPCHKVRSAISGPTNIQANTVSRPVPFDDDEAGRQMPRTVATVLVASAAG
jgi:hypothetical protein